MDQAQLTNYLSTNPALIQNAVAQYRAGRVAPADQAFVQAVMGALEERNRLGQQQQQQQPQQPVQRTGTPQPLLQPLPQVAQSSNPVSQQAGQASLSQIPPTQAETIREFQRLKDRETQLQGFMRGSNVSETDMKRAKTLLDQTQASLTAMQAHITALIRANQANQQSRIGSPAPSQATLPASAGTPQPQPSLPSQTNRPQQPLPSTLPESMTSSGANNPPQSSSNPIQQQPTVYYPPQKAEAAPPARPTLSQGIPALSPAVGSPALSRAPTTAQNDKAIISKRKLQELLEMVVGDSSSLQMEPEVENLLLEIADEFIDSVTKFACKLAIHRGSDRLEAQDVQLHLERNWGFKIPGWSADSVKMSQSKRTNQPPGYLARLAAAKEAQRKRM